MVKRRFLPFLHFLPFFRTRKKRSVVGNVGGLVQILFPNSNGKQILERYHPLLVTKTNEPWLKMVKRRFWPFLHFLHFFRTRKKRSVVGNVGGLVQILFPNSNGKKILKRYHPLLVTKTNEPGLKMLKEFKKSGFIFPVIPISLNPEFLKSKPLLFGPFGRFFDQNVPWIHVNTI